MKLQGSLCALITPFTREGGLDEAAWLRLIDLHLAAGSQGVVVAGSTGEAATLETNEHHRLLELAVDRAAGRMLVLAGTGTAGTEKTIRATRAAGERGADAALVVTPYYVRPTQQGLYHHYLEVAERGGLPVILYNVPSRTACDLLPETVARLAPHPRVIGIKEAVSDERRRAELRALGGEHFAVLSGDDGTACAAMLAGFDGVISVAANVVPGPFAELCDHARAGRADRARDLDGRLADLYGFLGSEPNPIPVKWLLARQGLCDPQPRLPLTLLSQSLHAQAETILAALSAASPAAAA